jgi:hypothetical protein
LARRRGAAQQRSFRSAPADRCSAGPRRARLECNLSSGFSRLYLKRIVFHLYYIFVPLFYVQFLHKNNSIVFTSVGNVCIRSTDSLKILEPGFDFLLLKHIFSDVLGVLVL